MYYYTYTDQSGKVRGISANSKYEALYNASCLCGALIPSNRMKRSGKVEAMLEKWEADKVFPSTCKLNPRRSTLAAARSKMNKIGF